MVLQYAPEVMTEDTGTPGGGSGAPVDDEPTDESQIVGATIRCDRYQSSLEIGAHSRGWMSMTFFPAGGEYDVTLGQRTYHIKRIKLTCSDHHSNKGETVEIVNSSLDVDIHRAMPAAAHASLLLLAQSNDHVTFNMRMYQTNLHPITGRYLQIFGSPEEMGRSGRPLVPR